MKLHRIIASVATPLRVLLALAGLGLASLLRATENETPTIGEPPGGLRPLVAEIDGRWIGNGISFGPYRRGQRPGGPGPSEAEVLEDLRIVVRHWNLIRMYGASRESEMTLRLIREHHLPIRMILGAWIGGEATDAGRAANHAEVKGVIRMANTYRDIVLAVNVGNESQVHWSGHRCDREALIGYIRETRAGISQPVTTADDYDFWNKPEASAIAAEVDFVMMHAYALWNSRQLEEAMSWTGDRYHDIRHLYPNRTVIIGETGWATSHVLDRPGPGGESVKMKAETSVAAQETYLRQHNAWVDTNKVVTLLFQAFDENWKGSGPSGDLREAEKNWGVFTEDRRPKASFLHVMRERQPAVALLYADRPLVFGHRGFAKAAPENTLPSFEAALLAGPDLVELDYHHSRDGVPVIMHDPTLDRTTNAAALWGGKNIRVADKTVAELAALDAGSWYGPRFAGTHVPLLTDALEVIQKGSVALIERKAGDAATLARLLRERGLVNRVIVQSFDWNYLRELHELLPEQVLAALGPHDMRDSRKMSAEEKNLDDIWLDHVSEAGVSAVVWYYRNVTAESIRRAHERGIRVCVYTVNDPSVVSDLVSIGVDGMGSDNPAMVWKALATRSQP